MTHLNTIIEEEVETYKNDYAQAITDVGGFGLAKHIERFLTTAMQRAYEAGRADWLRSEIEKLETFSKMVPNLSVVDTVGRKLDDSFGYKSSVLIGYQSALTTLITRYKEELLELEKGI